MHHPAGHSAAAEKPTAAAVLCTMLLLLLLLLLQMQHPQRMRMGVLYEASCRPHAWATPKPINHSFCSALAPALAAVASEAAPDPPAPAPAATARSRPSHSSLLLLLPSAPWPGQPRGQQAPLTQSCPVPRSGSPLDAHPRLLYIPKKQLVGHLPDKVLGCTVQGVSVVPLLQALQDA
eukprot:CAMPEP_0202897650 /NCGR_PEP_ID=MMETSP1392-20130828/6355_1 /ASSEMBLY_ACC=CAM_ASM_000868 /TAXON_ID=225041 /ORGANISM="Chlamydomonas chlamydogama, Strain SAG 11-48b" /LENGTH=177 /DNA_ID=CAMNT_0049583339 /DNA_START=554 /DNA_END=1089 /DNA_ORIENTATION=+